MPIFSVVQRRRTCRSLEGVHRNDAHEVQIHNFLQGWVKSPTGGYSPRPPRAFRGADLVKFQGRRSESGWEQEDVGSASTRRCFRRPRFQCLCGV